MHSIAGFRRKCSRNKSNFSRGSSNRATIQSPRNSNPRSSSPEIAPKPPIWSPLLFSGSSPQYKTGKKSAGDSDKQSAASTSLGGGSIRSLSSSPFTGRHRRQPSLDLCTIAEDRRISSNSLNKMAITTPAKTIARTPTIMLTTHFSEPLGLQQQPRLEQQPRRDPYNDDTDDDYTNSNDSFDCDNCWAYNKSRLPNDRGCCFFGFSGQLGVSDSEKWNGARGSSSFHSRSRRQLQRRISL